VKAGCFPPELFDAIEAVSEASSSISSTKIAGKTPVFPFNLGFVYFVVTFREKKKKKKSNGEEEEKSIRSFPPFIIFTCDINKISSLER